MGNGDATKLAKQISPKAMPRGKKISKITKYNDYYDPETNEGPLPLRPCNMSILRTDQYQDRLAGSVIVKDLYDNRHLVRFVATGESSSTKHVEIYLFDQLDRWVDQTKRGLHSAKIIFFCHFSPCKRCAPRLPRLSVDFARKLGRGSSGLFQFSFVYELPYVKGSDSKGHEDEMYESEEEARNWDAAATGEVRDLSGKVTQILVRPYSQTKAGSGGEERQSFKTDVPLRRDFGAEMAT